MSATIWTAVASRTRHRFRTGGKSPDKAACPCARKRRRRCALPAQSKFPAAPAPLEREINARVHRLYALTPAEIQLVEEVGK